MEKNNIGKFELTFEQQWFTTNAILISGEGVCKVTSTPKLHYNKWYYKLLNLLTFKKFFNVKYSYTVELIKLS